MQLINFILKIIYCFLPHLFTIPFMVYYFGFKKKEYKRLGEEKFLGRLERISKILQVVFVLETFLTIYFIAVEGLKEGVIGFFAIALIFIVRASIHIYIEGIKRGVLKE